MTQQLNSSSSDLSDTVLPCPLLSSDLSILLPVLLTYASFSKRLLGVRSSTKVGLELSSVFILDFLTGSQYLSLWCLVTFIQRFPCWLRWYIVCLQWGKPRFNPCLESERSPGEQNDYRLLYSCLENSTDRGAWQATVRGVAKSWTWPWWHSQICAPSSSYSCELDFYSQLLFSSQRYQRSHSDSLTCLDAQ